MKKAVILAVSATFAAGMILFAVIDRPVTSTEVHTITVTAMNTRIKVRGSGELEPYRKRSLGVIGYAIADEIYLNVGDPVCAGQVIMTFESSGTPAEVINPSAIVDSVDIEKLLNGDAAAVVNGTIADMVATEELVSPFDGVLTAVNINKGEQASPFQVLAEVSDLNRVRARIRLSEDDLKKVEVGMPAEVISGDVCRAAVVIEKSPIIRTSMSLTGGSERYGEALLELYDQEEIIVGGSATANIYTEMRMGMLTVPFEAVDQDENGCEFVFAVDGDCVHRRYIVTGDEFGDNVEVVSGIFAGDSVVVSSATALADGERVEVVQ